MGLGGVHICEAPRSALSPHGPLKLLADTGLPVLDAVTMAICLQILTGAIQRQCVADIVHFHEQNPDLERPVPEDFALLAWYVTTAEPAYEPLEDEELEDEKDY